MNDAARTAPAAYVRPELARVGALETLTQGHSTGSHLDASFAAGTGKSQLTFS